MSDLAKKNIIETLIDLIDCSEEEAEILTDEIVKNLNKEKFYIKHEL